MPHGDLFPDDTEFIVGTYYIGVFSKVPCKYSIDVDIAGGEYTSASIETVEQLTAEVQRHDGDIQQKGGGCCKYCPQIRAQEAPHPHLRHDCKGKGCCLFAPAGGVPGRTSEDEGGGVDAEPEGDPACEEAGTDYT